MAISPTPVQIRPARRSDHPAIVELCHRVFARYGPYGRVVPEWLVREDVEALVARCAGGDLCGALLLARTVRDGEPTAEILAVGVAEGHRRRGVGTALIIAALERVATWPGAPPRGVRLNTAEDNAPARALFDRFGFVDAGDALGCYEGGQPILALVRLLSARGGATPGQTTT